MYPAGSLAAPSQSFLLPTPPLWSSFLPPEALSLNLCQASGSKEGHEGIAQGLPWFLTKHDASWPTSRPMVGPRSRNARPAIESGVTIRTPRSVKFELSIRTFSAPEDDLPAYFPWRTLNRLHINTKEGVIRRELLFEEGDRLNPDLVREVLRNLRALDFFRDERIECSLSETGKVRIDVYLRENWSLIPIFQIQGVDTAQAVTLGVTEQNLLGRGKRLSAWGRKGAEARNTFIEDSWGVRYVDPNIMGSWYRFAGTIQDLETGEFLQAIAEHPFYSLETPWSASLFGQHFRRERRLIRNGEIASVFEQQDNTGGIDFSFALRRGPPVVHRIGPFYEYAQKRVRDYRIVAEEGRGTRTSPG